VTLTAVLLDTHIVLWAMQDPGRLGAARTVVEDPGVTRHLSAASIWEVAIKVALGRLDLPVPVPEWAERAASDLAAERLAVTQEHAAAVAALPRHHGDPFDRLLVAQARALSVPIITADADIGAYDVDVLPV
jgi:PIN domain nuclease of toxin-antitoxin system